MWGVGERTRRGSGMRLPALPLLHAVVLFASVQARAQPLRPNAITRLSTSLNETSGLLVANGTVWTQLDGGHPHKLFQVDTLTGAVLREVEIANAVNADWEDLCTDGRWVFIGDFGNNNGNRTDLHIYRFPLDALLDTSMHNVTADTIRFAYADQTNYTPARHRTNFDCEAFVAVDDSLFLFTKNWKDGHTVLYTLPAVLGDHIARPRATMDTRGLITGATHDPETGAIALVGYTRHLYTPFVWTLSGYTGHAFFAGSAVRHTIRRPFLQMEAIAWQRRGSLLLTNERSPFRRARLQKVEVDVPPTHAAAPSPDPSVLPARHGSLR